MGQMSNYFYLFIYTHFRKLDL